MALMMPMGRWNESILCMSVYWFFSPYPWCVCHPHVICYEACHPQVYVLLPPISFTGHYITISFSLIFFFFFNLVLNQPKNIPKNSSHIFFFNRSSLVTILCILNRTALNPMMWEPHTVWKKVVILIRWTIRLFSGKINLEYFMVANFEKKIV